MSPSAMWYVPVVSLIVWASGLLAGDRPSLRDVFRSMLPGLLVGLVGYLVTLPSTLVFQPGQALGWGIVIGAVAAALGCITLSRGGSQARLYSPLRCAAATAPLLAAAWLVYRVLIHVRVESLGGICAGWTCTFLLATVLSERESPAEGRYVSALLATAAAAVLCSALILSTQKAAALAPAVRWAEVILQLSIAGLLGVLAMYGVASRSERFGVHLVSAVVTAAFLPMTAMMIHRLAPITVSLGKGLTSIALITTIGAVGGVALGAFATTRSATQSFWEVGLSALLGVGLALPGLQLAAGLGGSLALLSALPPLATILCYRRPSQQTDGAAIQPWVTVYGAVAALMPVIAILTVRIATERDSFPYVGFARYDYLTTLTLVSATLIPGVLASIQTSRRTFLTMVMLMCIAWLWPTAFIVAWGDPVFNAIVVGIGLASFVSLAPCGLSRGLRWTPWLCIIGFSSALFAAPVVAPFCEYSRLVRALIAATPIPLVAIAFALSRGRTAPATAGRT